MNHVPWEGIGEEDAKRRFLLSAAHQAKEAKRQAEESAISSAYQTKHSLSSATRRFTGAGKPEEYRPYQTPEQALETPGALPSYAPPAAYSEEPAAGPANVHVEVEMQPPLTES